DHLVLGPAEHPFGARIPRSDATGHVEHHNGKVRRALDDQAQPPLAFTQRFLSVFALSDVPEGRHGRNSSLIVIANGSRADRQGGMRTLSMYDLDFLI